MPHNVPQTIMRRHRYAATLASEAAMPQYMLVTADGRYLHESTHDGALTNHRCYAWRGPREKMRLVLDRLPERTRKLLKPLRVFAPRPAGRAR